MTPTSSKCNAIRLQQSLSDRLSEQQEEQLSQHLTECDECRSQLEAMAGNAGSWRQIGSILREETIAECAAALPASASAVPGQPLSAESGDELSEGPALKPSDFIVDFLQPSQTRDSLGRLGNIEIRQFIGQGAHGIVLRGFQAELNRLVAVKVMAPHLAAVVAARKRFAREARATAAIVHPNVMPILHVDSSGQLPYLVMPYVDCESLQDRLDREGSLSISDTLRIGLQVARGLAAAHVQGLVHRDVKPANILLECGVERVMLTDFGLARAVDDATLTRSGLIAGTPHYMSPEQARGDSVDTRSDQFSLGSVLYAMSSGRPPFRAETTYGILRRVTDDEPRSLRELNPEIPAWFEAVVMKLLAKSAAARFESAEHLAQVFEECLAHLQQPNSFPLPHMLTDPGRTKGGWRFEYARLLQRLPPAIVLIVLSVAMVFVVWSGFQSADSTQRDADQIEASPVNNEPEIPWDDGLAEDLQQLDTEIEKLLQGTGP